MPIRIFINCKEIPDTCILWVSPDESFQEFLKKAGKKLGTSVDPTNAFIIDEFGLFSTPLTTLTQLTEEDTMVYLAVSPTDHPKELSTIISFIILMFVEDKYSPQE